MKIPPIRTRAFPAWDKTRPLTLDEVLRLRDGLEICRGNISGTPIQFILPNFNRKELLILCKN